MVDEINFGSNVTGTTNNPIINKARGSKINNFWTNYFNNKKLVAETNSVNPENQTIAGMKNKFTASTYQVLQDVEKNFATVSNTIPRNTKQENLVIDDAYYIPDREYAEAEI